MPKLNKRPRKKLCIKNKIEENNSIEIKILEKNIIRTKNSHY